MRDSQEYYFKFKIIKALADNGPLSILGRESFPLYAVEHKGDIVAVWRHKSLKHDPKRRWRIDTLAVADKYMDAKRYIEELLGDGVESYDYSGSVWHRSQKL